jgi:hypothetical protein
MSDDVKVPKVDEEQVLYARILETGMYIGLAVLLVTFSLYATGIVAPCVPVEDLPRYWVMSAQEFVEAANQHHLHREFPITGWAWLSVLGKGDYLNFLGIALLALVTVVCFLGIVPTLLRKHDRIYAAMAVAEAAILTLAASGILTAGH